MVREIGKPIRQGCIGRRRLRERLPILNHALDVQRESLEGHLSRLADRFSRRHASWKIREHDAIIRVLVLADDRRKTLSIASPPQLQAALPSDRPDNLDPEIARTMHRHRHLAGLRRMPELPARDSRTHLAPAIGLESADYVARLHTHKMRIVCRPRKDRPGRSRWQHNHRR
jgi:hypothetical protein